MSTGEARRGHGAIASVESIQSDNGKTESRTCHICKQVGHLMKECPQRDPPKETHANNKEKLSHGMVIVIIVEGWAM